MEKLENSFLEFKEPYEDKLQDVTQECYTLARQVDKYDKNYRAMLGD